MARGNVLWAAYHGSLKYIEYSDGNRQLHDLAEDPEELRDLVSTRPADANRLQALLADWILRTPPAEQAPVESEPDAETLKKLESLGYVKQPARGRGVALSPGSAPLT